MKLKTNAVMIHEAEAERIRELGVTRCRSAFTRTGPEVHDAITMLPGSLKRSMQAIRLLHEQRLEGNHREMC